MTVNIFIQWVVLGRVYGMLMEWIFFFFAVAKVVNCGQILQWRGAFRMVAKGLLGVLV